MEFIVSVLNITGLTLLINLIVEIWNQKIYGLSLYYKLTLIVDWSIVAGLESSTWKQTKWRNKEDAKLSQLYIVRGFRKELAGL